MSEIKGDTRSVIPAGKHTGVLQQFKMKYLKIFVLAVLAGHISRAELAKYFHPMEV